MSERKMILRMLNEGKITLEEADALLEAMEMDEVEKVDEAIEEVEEVSEIENDNDKKFESKDESNADWKDIEEGINEDLKSAKVDIQDGFDEVKKGFKNMKDNFKNEGLHDIKSALGGIADQINEGVHDLKDNMEESKGFSKTLKGDGLKKFVGNLVKSFGVNHSITLRDQIDGEFAASDNPVTIDLQTKNGRVELVGWEEDKYQIKLKYDINADTEEEAEEIKDDMCEITQEDDLLKIETSGLIKGGVSLRVYIPMELKANVKLKSTNGRIGLSNLKTEGNYDIKTSNGRIQLGGLRAKEIEAETTNGRIEVEDYASDKVDLKSSNGSVYLDGLCNETVIETSNGTISAYPYISEKGHMDLKTTNGKIKVILKNPETAIDLDAQTSMGNITLEIPDIVYQEKIDRHMKKKYQAQSEKYIDSDERLQIQAETTMGSIFVGQYEEK